MLINAAQMPFLYKIEADLKCTKEDMKVRRSGIWRSVVKLPWGPLHLRLPHFEPWKLPEGRSALKSLVYLTPGGILTVTAYLSIRKMLARIR